MNSFLFHDFLRNLTHNYLNKSIKITPNLKILAMQRNVSQKNISKLLNPCLAENIEECIIYLFFFKKLDFEPKTSISYIFPSFSLEPNQKPKKIPILTKQN